MALDIEVISVPLNPVAYPGETLSNVELAVPDISLLPDYSSVDQDPEWQRRL